MDFTHLLLDCDGVMVDSERASCEALRRAILEVTGTDIPHRFPEDFVHVFSLDVRSCVAWYSKSNSKISIDPETVRAIEVAKEAHYRELTRDGVPAFDGVARLMRRALAAGLRVGVASSGSRAKLLHNLGTSGLLIPELIPDPDTAIVSTAQVAAGKPTPDVFLAVMANTGCTDPRRALVVEDAIHGLQAGRAAGAFTVGITNSLPGHLLAPWADRVIAHLDELTLESLTLVRVPRCSGK
ncbi:Protein CbbY, plasmid [Tetrabaena socialis]|uniref:Protein CbbY, plasmid n=1 Tax=Tetrabaena socialis TaxID=47790 RepID=A0A2J7ZMP0_9CHLO|nr:Protein CbbY, plasmid [Tetrabaena socialis]|eukprot:PNH01531.1 Protein CbbY, plasmid [Tetrabaena socialis]